MTQGLYKFTLDCKRQGTVEGLFIADDSEVSEAVGQKIYITDALGRHAHVDFVLTQEMIMLKSTNPEVLSIITELDLEQGENPLLHIYKSCAVCNTWLYSGEDKWIVGDTDKEAWERSGRCVDCEPLKAVLFDDLSDGTYFMTFNEFAQKSQKVKGMAGILKLFEGETVYIK